MGHGIARRVKSKTVVAYGQKLAIVLVVSIPLVRGAPPTQPGITDGAEPSGVDDAEGRGEGLKGADERRAFRQEQRGHSTDDGG